MKQADVLPHHKWKQIYMTDYLQSSYVSTQMCKILMQDWVNQDCTYISSLITIPFYNYL